MPSRGLRRVLLLITTGLLLTLGAPSATALSWVPGPSLPFGFDEPQIWTSTANDGTTYMVRQVGLDASAVVYLRRMTPSNPTGVEQAIGSGLNPQVAVTDSGLIITWFSTTGDHPLMLARATRDGTITSTVTVADVASPDRPSNLAVLPSGDAVVSWGSQSPSWTLHVRKVPAGGSPGPLLSLGEYDDMLGTAPGSVSLSADGRPWIAWVAPDGGNAAGDPSDGGLRVARLTTGGARDGSADLLAPGDALRSLKITAGSSGATASWLEYADPPVSDTRLRAQRLTSGGLRAGPIRTVATALTDKNAGSTGASTGSDDATHLLYAQTPEDVLGSRVWMRRLSADGTLAAAVALSDPATPHAVPVTATLSSARDGSMLAVWGNEPRAQATVGWMAATSSFSARALAADGTPASAIVGLDVPDPKSVFATMLSAGARGVGSFSWIASDLVFPQPLVHNALLTLDVADFAASIPSSAVVGENAEFVVRATGATGIRSAEWDFGDGIEGSGSSVAHAYGRSGRYTVSVAVTDVTGAVTTRSGAILVSEPVVGPMVVPPGTQPPAGPGTTESVRAAARLKLTKATRTRTAVVVKGTINRSARGRITVTWTQKAGRKTTRRTARATIGRSGAFAVTIKLTPAQRRSRTRGTLTAAYAGSTKIAAATVRRTLKAPKR